MKNILIKLKKEILKFQIKFNGNKKNNINFFNSDNIKFSSSINNDSILNQTNTFIIKKNKKIQIILKIIIK